jgi:hypothetical protein
LTFARSLRGLFRRWLNWLLRGDKIFVILGEHAFVFLKRFAHTGEPLLRRCHFLSLRYNNGETRIFSGRRSTGVLVGRSRFLRARIRNENVMNHPAVNKVMKVKKPMSDQSILWGYSISWWDWFGARAMVTGAVLGVLALLISFIASYVLYRVADIAQSELQSKTIGLDKEIGDQKERTENLKAANLALESKIAPRRLTSQQQQSIGSALARFAGRRMRVKSYALDVEAAILGQQIIATLQAANIGGDDRRMSEGAPGAIAIGIHVTGDDKELIDATLAAFSSVGLAVSPEPVPIMAGMALSDDGTTVAATVFVGVKPLAQ